MAVATTERIYCFHFDRKSGNSLYVYDLKASSWKDCSSVVEELPFVGGVTVSATLDDSRNQILLLGASASGMCLAAVSLVVPPLVKEVSIQNLSSRITEHCILVAGDDLYLVGGHEITKRATKSERRIYRLSLVDDNVATVRGIITLNEQRNNPLCAFLHGRLWIYGGHDGHTKHHGGIIIGTSFFEPSLVYPPVIPISYSYSSMQLASCFKDRTNVPTVRIASKKRKIDDEDYESSSESDSDSELV